MAFAGVGVGFASECYSGDEFLLELSSTDREECLYACSVREERCLLFLSSHSRNNTSTSECLAGVLPLELCRGRVQRVSGGRLRLPVLASQALRLPECRQQPQPDRSV